jgi:hypothetical protein
MNGFQRFHHRRLDIKLASIIFEKHGKIVTRDFSCYDSRTPYVAHTGINVVRLVEKEVVIDLMNEVTIALSENPHYFRREK